MFRSVHGAVVRNPLALRLAVLTRVLLAVGFFAPGLTKLLGSRFVTEVTDDPVGVFFETLYQTGPYWRFLGAGQVLAAVLVLVPRTSALGALVFFGIILNVFMITVSLPFGSTAIVTGLMLLASLFLVFWEFPRWAPLVQADPGAPVPQVPLPTLARLERTGFAALVVGGWGMTCVMRGLALGPVPLAFGSAGLLAVAGGLMVLASWVTTLVRHGRPAAESGIGPGAAPGTRPGAGSGRR
ncbi:MAG: hypothetical protein ACYTG2_18940 [Planctomycetota bacterium]|jgi:hypothetical protein